MRLGVSHETISKLEFEKALGILKSLRIHHLQFDNIYYEQRSRLSFQNTGMELVPLKPEARKIKELCDSNDVRIESIKANFMINNKQLQENCAMALRAYSKIMPILGADKLVLAPAYKDRDLLYSKEIINKVVRDFEDDGNKILIENDDKYLKNKSLVEEYLLDTDYKARLCLNLCNLMKNNQDLDLAYHKLKDYTEIIKASDYDGKKEKQPIGSGMLMNYNVLRELRHFKGLIIMELRPEEYQLLKHSMNVLIQTP